MCVEQKTIATHAAKTEHPEIWLLAYALGELTNHCLMGISSDAEQHLESAALNFADCIAESVAHARANAVMSAQD